MDALRQAIRLIIERIHVTGQERFNFQHFKKLDELNDMMTYANLHLEELGEGSSRRVYVFSGNKVLKLATNRAGLGQNEQEVSVFTDPETAPIVARIHDYDPEYFWILSELTRPVKDSREFEALAGLADEGMLDIEEFCIDAVRGDFNFIDPYYEDPRVRQLARAIHAVAKKNKLLKGDIKKPDSWGKTPDGRLVLIDYGFSGGVSEKYY